MAGSFVKGYEGFDGIMTLTNYPWSSNNNAGKIVSESGKFGGQSLVVSGQSDSTIEIARFNFPSTAMISRTGTLSENKVGIAVGFWLQVDRAANVGTSPLIAIGTSENPTAGYNVMGITGNATQGKLLYWPSNLNTLTGLNSYAVNGDWKWIDLVIATYQNTWMMKVEVNGIKVLDSLIAWPTDNMSNVANQIVIKGSANNDYKIDDFVIRCISGADPEWPLAPDENPDLSIIDAMTSRRIYHQVPVANGTVTQWTPSAGQNYSAAASRTEYVTAEAVELTDTYKFTGQGTDIKALQYRSRSGDYFNCVPVVDPGNGVIEEMSAQRGQDTFVGILHHVDGTLDPWTVEAIDNAEFGQRSR